MSSTMEETAECVTATIGRSVTSDDLLRAGIQGAIVICAAFGFCEMYNATTGGENPSGHRC